jgi:FlaA1/EpsC-like NDP-sugar epimerase
MGDPVKIVDLARTMITLGGRSVRDEGNPSGEIEIVFVGLQPGEKLTEELLVADSHEPTEHPKIRRACEAGVAGGQLREALSSLKSACDRCDQLQVRELLGGIVERHEDVTPQIAILRTSGQRASSSGGCEALCTLW